MGCAMVNLLNTLSVKSEKKNTSMTSTKKNALHPFHSNSYMSYLLQRRSPSDAADVIHPASGGANCIPLLLQQYNKFV